VKYLISISFLFSILYSAACPTISITGNDVSCYLGTNGSSYITVTGPNAPFTATWSTGDVDVILSSGGSADAQFLPAGIYTVYVVDQLGCTSMNLVTINEPAPVVGSVSETDVNCFGDATGSIDLTPAGGTPNYTYAWSNGSSSQNISNLLAGNYSVTITDAYGCSSASIDAVISQPVQAVTSATVNTNISCQTGSDGAIDLSVYGGTPPYVYSWNSGAFNTEDLNGVSAGTYNLVVTDNKGCTAFESIVLTEPTSITSTIAGTDVNCYLGTDGGVNLTPSGGTPPYSFSWSNSTFTMGSSEDLTNVPAESYTVVITDANGCVATNNQDVFEPSQINTSITPTNVSCYGYSDGEVDLYVIGGTPGYTYAWSNSTGAVATTEDLTLIPAETYDVIVTDNNGCTATNGIVITQPLSPLTLGVVTSDVLCNGDATGEADLTILGGTQPYVISWSNGSNTEDQVGLAAATYIATVVDFNACTENIIAPISEPAFPLSTSISITDVSCFGGSDGEIDMTTAGGTIPYQFSWINSSFSLSAASEDLLSYQADIYVVTIMDGNNCVFVDTAIIEQPDLIETSIQTVDVLCFGESTGSIDMTITGGVLPYNFLWSNAEITEDISNLLAGSYQVSISDANGCFHSNSSVITEPLAALSSYDNIVLPSCYATSDGIINLTVNGGTLPYSYLWSNGDTVENIYNLNGGSYNYTVTDANGCTLTDVIQIIPPDQIGISAQITVVSCFEGSDGVIDLSIAGGSAGYSFHWTNSAYVLSVGSEDLTDFPADTYIVEVTDSLGCTNSASYILEEPEELILELDVHNITCYGANDGYIDAIVTGGNDGGYGYSWSNGEVSTTVISDLTPGDYFVNVYDTKGCEASDSATIIEPDLIVIGYDMTPVSCRDQSDGIIELAVVGGLGGYTYEWSNATSRDINDGLLGGDYSVEVTDMVGCQVDTTIEVTVLDIACLEVPSAFTPTGDGYNDTWKIKNIELYPDCEVYVYNKWGKLVFESTGYSEEWDGTFYTRPLPMATYYYIIRLNYTNNVDYSGPITIVK